MSEYKPFFHFLIIIHSLFYATSDLCRHCRALKILPTTSQWPAFRERPRLKKFVTYAFFPSFHLNEFNKKSKLFFIIAIIIIIIILEILSNEIRFHSFLFSLFSIKFPFAKTCLHRNIVHLQENALRAYRNTPPCVYRRTKNVRLRCPL